MMQRKEQALQERNQLGEKEEEQLGALCFGAWLSSRLCGSLALSLVFSFEYLQPLSKDGYEAGME
jgi:hypothetical protein